MVQNDELNRLPDPVTNQAVVQRILRERATRIARSPQDAADLLADSTDSAAVLALKIGTGEMGIPLIHVREVWPLQNWSPIPCTPAFIVGAINLRGRIFSLMDLGRFLGDQDRTPPEQGYAILVEGQDQSGGIMELCLLADDLPLVHHLSLKTLQPGDNLISARMQPYVQGVTQEMLVVLNLVHLLADPAILVHEEISL